MDGRQGVGEVPPLKLLFGDMVPVIPPAQPLCAPSLLKERERGPGEVRLATQGAIGRNTLPEVVQVLRSPALWKIKERRLIGLVGSYNFFSLQKGLTTCHPRKSPVLVKQRAGDDRAVRHDVKGADYLAADMCLV